jgi:hypothetical protein
VGRLEGDKGNRSKKIRRVTRVTEVAKLRGDRIYRSGEFKRRQDLQKWGV